MRQSQDVNTSNRQHLVLIAAGRTWRAPWRCRLLRRRTHRLSGGVTRVPGRYGGRALAARAACARQSRDVVAFRLSRNVATMDTMAERKG